MPWTDEELQVLKELVEAGHSNNQILNSGRLPDRSYSSIKSKRTQIIPKKHPEEISETDLPSKAKTNAVFEASLVPPIDLDKDQIIRELEARIARLQQQLTWAQHADSLERTGGVFTLRASDHHFGDANHLMSCCRQLEEKTGFLVEQYEPERINIVAGDDWVAGRGIYREQDLDMAVPDVNSQCAVGAMKARRFILDIREKSDAPIHWHVMRGNHDYSNGHSMTEYLFLLLEKVCSDIPDITFVMHWDKMILNLAAEGIYNVLIRHGFGYSKTSPNSPAFIDSVKDEIIAMISEMQPEERIRRVLSGHTHWMSVGLERNLDLFFDTTGGLQRNTRIRIGSNQRPSGWIAYVSPKGLENEILQPIELKPDIDVYRREIGDPHLVASNRQDCAEEIKNFHEHMKSIGAYSEGTQYGVVSEGRW